MAEKKEKKSEAKTEKSKPAKAATKAPTKKPAAKAKSASASGSGRLRGQDLVRKVSKLDDVADHGNFRSGDTVNVFVKVKEGEKERVQVYKGLVTKVQGSGIGRSFTVRKISAGVGVERTFPFASPSIDRIEVLTKGNVRRSKLYFLRELEGKAAKIESELVSADSSSSSKSEVESAGN